MEWKNALKETPPVFGAYLIIFKDTHGYQFRDLGWFCNGWSCDYWKDNEKSYTVTHWSELLPFPND